MWEEYLTYFAATGRDCYSFSWLGHRGSRELPVDQYVARSMTDTVEELEIVAAHVGQVPVLITHSMGGDNRTEVCGEASRTRASASRPRHLR
jgi:pimeloyl-ACP methyl ester carboxylesterase